MAVRSDGKKAYVSSGNFQGGTVAVIDTSTEKVISKVKVGDSDKGSALGLDVNPFWWFEH